WWLRESQAQAPQSGQPDKASVAPKDASAAGIVDKPIHARWTFEKGPADDLKLIQGHWEWKLIQGKGQMATSPNVLTMIRLPFEIPPRPLVVKIRSLKHSAGEFSFGAAWREENRLPFRYWRKFLDLKVPQRSMQIDCDIYCVDRYIVSTMNGEFSFVAE